MNLSQDMKIDSKQKWLFSTCVRLCKARYMPPDFNN